MIKKLVLLCLLSLITFAYPEYGFKYDTLITLLDGTSQQLITLQKDTNIAGFIETNRYEPMLVNDSNGYMADRYVEIIINDEQLICDADQLLYSAQHEAWLPAQTFSKHDTLLSMDGKHIAIQSVNLIKNATILIAISCEPPHVYGVTQYHILAHNHIRSLQEEEMLRKCIESGEIVLSEPNYFSIAPVVAALGSLYIPGAAMTSYGTLSISGGGIAMAAAQTTPIGWAVSGACLAYLGYKVVKEIAIPLIRNYWWPKKPQPEPEPVVTTIVDPFEQEAQRQRELYASIMNNTIGLQAQTAGVSPCSPPELNPQPLMECGTPEAIDRFKPPVGAGSCGANTLPEIPLAGCGGSHNNVNENIGYPSCGLTTPSMPQEGGSCNYARSRPGYGVRNEENDSLDVSDIETIDAIVHAKSQEHKKPKGDRGDKGKTKPKEEVKAVPKPGPNGVYEDSEKHDIKERYIDAKGEIISPAPQDGQTALDNSIETALRERIGVSKGQIVKLKLTEKGKYHGFTVDWKELSDKIQKKLKAGCLTDKRGRPLLGY